MVIVLGAGSGNGPGLTLGDFVRARPAATYRLHEVSRCGSGRVPTRVGSQLATVHPERSSAHRRRLATPMPCGGRSWYGSIPAAPDLSSADAPDALLRPSWVSPTAGWSLVRALRPLRPHRRHRHANSAEVILVILVRWAAEMVVSSDVDRGGSSPGFEDCGGPM